jgi:hypothetical protein
MTIHPELIALEQSCAIVKRLRSGMRKKAAWQARPSFS